MLSVNPKEVKHSLFHSYLVGAIAPRPIAFASTLDKDGNPNLAPFSFFNVFSGNPPILVFSPARSGRTGHHKHTYENIKEYPEVVINVVSYSMVEQTSLASTEYPKGVNEFVKAGFTAIASEMVKPLRVKESPVQLECKVKQVIELGDNPGAGNLIICEVVLMHIDESILDKDNHIDPHKIDLVGRMGANWYVRAANNALFEVQKPNANIGIGYDAIPAHIRNSHLLSGNDLGKLANITAIPAKEEVEEFHNTPLVKEVLENCGKDYEKLSTNLYNIAKQFLAENKVNEAWKVLSLIKE
jgi:flavin reductase (DIM6/NTAB) family NADH-FMN oxidoreductase RutF